MRRLFMLLTAGWLLTAGVTPQAAPDLAARRPRLIVFLSIDQFRGDYVERYGQHWNQGLRRLFDRGAYFSQAAYPYMNTVTCAGHATMSTGTFPATHGLPLNAWFDRESGKQVACTQDPNARNMAHGAVPTKGGDSIWRLRVPTFSDELRVQSGIRPRIVALSMKARSAIMLAGHQADVAAWYDGASGFVTSSAYTSAPLPFLRDFQQANPIEADAGKVWDKTLPAASYQFADDGLGEKPEAPWTNAFPHALPAAADKTFYTLWEDTPFADAYLGRMAAAAVQQFKMGRGPGTDYLAVSFSTLDLLGHAFGPRSHEVQDELMRLDSTIGKLLQELDRQVGPEHYVVALTGDHGVSPIPEQMGAEGLEAGRIDGKALVERINKVLEPLLGAGPHTEALIYTDLYFKAGVAQKLREQPEAMRAVVRAIESTPGVWRAIDSDDITNVHLGIDQLALTALYSYAPGRSGDMLIVPRPYFLNSTSAATHGTGYRYDARVPVVLTGPGIQPGEHAVPSTPADIAPTLAYLVGITMPRTDGRVLREALQARPPSSAATTAARPAGRTPTDRKDP